MSISGADSTGGLIIITKNGSPVKKIKSEGLKYNVPLDLNAKYLIKASKKGYITKIVYFNTTIPEGRETGQFAKFTMTIELHKTIKGEKTDSTKPVGEVKYDPEVDDFDVVKN